MSTDEVVTSAKKDFKRKMSTFFPFEKFKWNICEAIFQSFSPPSLFSLNGKSGRAAFCKAK